MRVQVRSAIEAIEVTRQPTGSMQTQNHSHRQQHDSRRDDNLARHIPINQTPTLPVCTCGNDKPQQTSRCVTPWHRVALSALSTNPQMLPAQPPAPRHFKGTQVAPPSPTIHQPAHPIKYRSGEGNMLQHRDVNRVQHHAVPPLSRLLASSISICMEQQEQRISTTGKQSNSTSLQEQCR